MNNQEISYVLSIVSLFFYSIVYVPQFLVIFNTKSSEGVSTWTLLLWTQADVLSLIGTIVLYMPTSIILIGWYHYTIGILMLLYVLYYKDKSDTNYKLECWSTAAFLLANTTTCIFLNSAIQHSYDEIGLVLGWVTMAFYTGGRLPQIQMNYKNGSTGNLSVLMYIFTIIGNSFYVGVITVDPEFIEVNIPWIVNGIVSILLDIIVLWQYYYYNYTIKDNKQVV